MEQLKDGDIYFWKWKEIDKGRSLTDEYWCKSRIAIVENGKAIDTYWFSGNNLVLDFKKVEMEFQGNINEMIKTEKWEVKYYNPEDIVDLYHPNGGGPILRKSNAIKDKKTISINLKRRYEEAERGIESAILEIKMVRKNQTLLESGKIDDIHF